MKKRNRTPSTWGPVPKKDRPVENGGSSTPPASTKNRHEIIGFHACFLAFLREKL